MNCWFWQPWTLPASRSLLPCTSFLHPLLMCVIKTCIFLFLIQFLSHHLQPICLVQRSCIFCNIKAAWLATSLPLSLTYPGQCIQVSLVTLDFPKIWTHSWCSKPLFCLGRHVLRDCPTTPCVSSRQISQDGALVTALIALEKPNRNDIQRINLLKTALKEVSFWNRRVLLISDLKMIKLSAWLKSQGEDK